MDRLQAISSGIILFTLVATTVMGPAHEPPSSSDGTGTATGEAADHVVSDHNTPLAEKEQKTPSSWDVLKSVFTVYTSSPINAGYFGKLRASLNQAYLYLFPPNIDFRGSKEGGEEAEGEKVREALGKSLGKAKETVEVSAEKAAKLIKNTISPSHDNENTHPLSPHEL
jgi:hypothetical protein